PDGSNDGWGTITDWKLKGRFYIATQQGGG
ncbi:unnamed protein product, partial [marine sediment metagenome]